MAKAKKAAQPRELPKGLRRALAVRKPSVDSEALSDGLDRSVGRHRAACLDLHHEFQKAAVGGMTRQRILEMIQRLILTNTTHQIGQASAPSDMTDEELEMVAMRYMRKVVDDAPATP